MAKTCKELGWKVGDEFIVVDGQGYFEDGERVILVTDDGSTTPEFEGGGETWWLSTTKVISCPTYKPQQQTLDEVNSPNHYNNGNIECIEAIKAALTPAEFQGYLKGNAMKYLWRMQLKGKPLVDVQKAQWYVNKLTETLSEEVKEKV